MYEEVLSCWKPNDSALLHAVKNFVWKKKRRKKKKGILSETYSRKMLETKIHPINTSFKTKSTDMANYLHVFFFTFCTGLMKSRSPRSSNFFLLSIVVCKTKIYAGAKKKRTHTHQTKRIIRNIYIDFFLSTTVFSLSFQRKYGTKNKLDSKGRFVEFSWNFMTRFFVTTSSYFLFFFFFCVHSMKPHNPVVDDGSVSRCVFQWYFILSTIFIFREKKKFPTTFHFGSISRFSFTRFGRRSHYMWLFQGKNKISYICFDEEGKVNRTVLFNDSILGLFCCCYCCFEMVDWSIGTFSFSLFSCFTFSAGEFLFFILDLFFFLLLL